MPSTFQPPREVLDAAAALNVTAFFQERGHAELEDASPAPTRSSSRPASSRSGPENPSASPTPSGSLNGNKLMLKRRYAPCD
jgi:hypothetical protein